MDVGDRRLARRAEELVQTSRFGRLTVLALVVFVVALNTVADALSGYYLLVDSVPSFRAWAVVSMGLTGVINIVLVVLVWMLFETLARVERESDRLQAFMDNMYRRGMG